MAALIAAAAIDFSKPFRKVLYIMRGPPGSGKSSVARLLLQKHLAAQGLRWNPSQPGAAFSPICRAFICSTDDYFTKVDDEGDAIYDFEPQRLRELHQKNQQRCRDAMELSQTPLFVDNTNMALWEMSEYVMLAEELNYAVMIIGAEQLGAGALDLRVLQMRCAQEAGRADGKEIPSTTLERMISRYEPLPEEVKGVRFWNAAELDLLKSAKPKPRFRYAGLDVETSVLEALAAIDLGPFFWEEAEQPEGQRHFLAARMADRWTSPDRLHVTVLYFGKDSKRQEAEELVGRTFAVKVSGLVFIRGGSLLCATCEFSSDDYETLASLSEDWRPHITLLFSGRWRPKHSNDMLVGMEEAVRRMEAAPEAGSIEVEETQLDPVSQPDSMSTEDVVKRPQVRQTMHDHPHGTLQVLSGVSVSDEANLDLCVLQLSAPLDLGNCDFKLF